MNPTPQVLVTGASGFTGKHLVALLVSRGYRVKAMVRSAAAKSLFDDSSCEVVLADLCHAEDLQTAVQSVDWVFHTAAYVDLGLVDPQRMQQTNHHGTKWLLEACREAGVKRFIHCGTIGIYGDTAGQIADETFQRTQTTFSSAYDESKFLAQQLVDAQARDGFETVSILPSGIFGPGDPHFGPAVNAFLNGKLPFWAGSERITGIVDVDDLCELMLLAAEKGVSGEHYIASAGELTTREMFRILGESTGRPPPRELPEPLVRALALLLDGVGRMFSFNPVLCREKVHYLYDRCVRVSANKARNELGWTPMTPEQTLQRLLT